MGKFDDKYNVIMEGLFSKDPSKDVGTYDKNGDTNAKTDADVNFAAFVKENVGKVLIKRRFKLEFFGNKPKYSFVSDNFMSDDIRKITKIKKSLFGGYSFTMQRLNKTANRNERVVTIPVKSFDELKKMFDGFKHPQFRIEDYYDEVWIEIVSNKDVYDFGEYGNLDHMTHNPADFVFAEPGLLSDWNKIENTIVKTIASKLGKSEEEIKRRINNDDDILPKEWKFRDHNVELTNYAMG